MTDQPKAFFEWSEELNCWTAVISWFEDDKQYALSVRCDKNPKWEKTS